jgi:hypothetical protein
VWQETKKLDHVKKKVFEENLILVDSMKVSKALEDAQIKLAGLN